MKRITENPNYDKMIEEKKLKEQQEKEQRKREKEARDNEMIKRYLDKVQYELDSFNIPKNSFSIFKPRYIKKTIVLGREETGTFSSYHNTHGEDMNLLAKRISEKTGWEVTGFYNDGYDANGQYGITIILPRSEIEG